jgi:hypothetical protein
MFKEVEIEITGLFTTHHHFRTASGLWGELTIPAFSEGAIFRRGDGHELVMRKVHWLGTAYELLEGEKLRALADRSRLLSRDFAIDFNGQQYRLEAEGWLGQDWTLCDGWGNCLLEIRPRGILRQRVHLTVNAALAGDLAAFAYYLVHVRRQEEAAGAAAATGAAAS